MSLYAAGKWFHLLQWCMEGSLEVVMVVGLLHMCNFK